MTQQAQEKPFVLGTHITRDMFGYHLKAGKSHIFIPEDEALDVLHDLLANMFYKTGESPLRTALQCVEAVKRD